MRFYSLQKLLLGTLLLVFTLRQAQAQNESLPRFVGTNVDNATKLLEAYFNPAFDAFGAVVNAGWYNTAEAHGWGKFDLRVVGGLSFVSQADKSYDVRALGLTNVAVLEGERSSTIFGNDTDRQLIQYQPAGSESEQELSSFRVVEGLGFGFGPSASIQATIGLPKGTEVMIRFIPKIPAGEDTKFNNWGFGIKHEITESIPKVNLLPFDIALGFAYSQATFDYDVFLGPSTNPSTGESYPAADPSESPDYNNQNINLRTSAWNVSLLASKKIAFLTIFGGFRYDNATTTLKAEGTYPITNADFEVENFENPITVENNFNQIGLNGGLRVRAGVFAFSVDGTLSKYSSVSFGIALGRFGLDI